MPLAHLSVGFQSLPQLLTSKLGLSGAGFQVGVFVYILWVSPMNSPVGLGVSPTAATPTGFNSQRFWGFISLCWNPGLHSLSRSPVVPPSTPAATSPAQFWSCCLAMHPLPTSCWSPPLLPVWMNVSSLTPWLLDFHTVRFSGSSGYFLFLNLLSSFWFCEEAKCIYLHLHLGQKSSIQTFCYAPWWKKEDFTYMIYDQTEYYFLKS